jgi:hypothetical protein
MHPHQIARKRTKLTPKPPVTSLDLIQKQILESETGALFLFFSNKFLFFPEFVQHRTREEMFSRIHFAFFHRDAESKNSERVSGEKGGIWQRGYSRKTQEKECKSVCTTNKCKLSNA